MNYVYFVRGARHAAMAGVSIASVRLADPGAICWVYTDGPEDLVRENLGIECHVRSRGVPGQPMMLANLDLQCRAIAEFYETDRITFLDTDVLVLGQLPSVNADLTVTYRHHVLEDEDGQPIRGIATQQPYNYGVIGVRPSYYALQAFMWMRERIRTLSPNLQKWYGNQVALAALCGRPPQTGEARDARNIPWTLTSYGDAVRVHKIPCERWNYTPQKAGERTHGLRSFLHFKGGKRALMRGYAESLGIAWPAILEDEGQKKARA